MVSTDFSGNITASTQSMNPDVWEQIYDVELLENNCFLLAGRTRDQNLGNWEGLYLEVEPDIASYNWSLQYAGEFSTGFSKIVNSSDNYNLLGFTSTEPPECNNDILLISTDTSGNVQWETTIGLDEDEYENDMLILENENIIIFADTYSYAPDSRNLWLLCLGQEVSTNEDLPVLNFHLSNHPNPFNPSTEIRFQLSDFSEIESAEIEIYNLKGQKMKSIFPSLYHPELIEGRGNEFSVIWNGKDINEQPVSSGVYLYKLIVDGETKATRKCLLLK